MQFSSKLSKFGKGKNISALMIDKNTIDIYFFDGGINKKVLNINNDLISLTKENISLGYNEVIPITKNYLLTRIDKSIGIIYNDE